MTAELWGVAYLVLSSLWGGVMVALQPPDPYDTETHLGATSFAVVFISLLWPVTAVGYIGYAVTRRIVGKHKV